MAQYTSTELITSPKRDKAFILRKKYTELGLKKKIFFFERIAERVSKTNKGKVCVLGVEISRVKKTDLLLGGA